jgi:hypothetical protein
LQAIQVGERKVRDRSLLFDRSSLLLRIAQSLYSRADARYR